MPRLPFRALWTHRYHKYRHIADQYRRVGLAEGRLRLLRLRIGQRPVVTIALSEQFGDIVACEPVIREVRRRYPDGYLVWIVKPGFVSLLTHHPDIDLVLTEHCPAERTRLLASGVFDAVFNLHLSHRNCQYCPQDSVNPTADRLGITYANYFDFGALLPVFSRVAGLPELDDEPRVYIPETDRLAVDALGLSGPGIVIHCESSLGTRDWQSGHWHRLVQHLLDTTPWPVYEIGLAGMVRHESPRFRSLCGQLSILATAEVIRRSRLFVGIESGPAHLANATGVPGVLLLGRLAAFDTYMPWSGRYGRGQDCRVVQIGGKPCAELPYSAVAEAVDAMLTRTAEPA
jgi:heptosyltransferase III